MLKFKEDGHLYISTNQDDKKWLSVTTLVSKFKTPFDPNIVYHNVKNPQSKWYGMDPQKVLAIWTKERDRSTNVGSWFHKKMEDSEIAPKTTYYIKDGWKYAGNQYLSEGIYPEHFIYNANYNICGQADRVIVTKQCTVEIEDYKSNKKLDIEGFRGKTMLDPVSHLQDCHLMHYALQMSFYMWMILQHNQLLLPGKLTIKHVKFKHAGMDKNGYPIIAKNSKGEYLYESITPITVPYLEREVISILSSLQV